MAFYDYHFVTHWKIRGPVETAFRILKDGPKYSEWWKPAYVKTEEVGPQKVLSLVRAKLPYTLAFTTELVRDISPTEIEIRAAGELVGKGLWKLKQVGETTEVTFYWDVQAAKPIVRWLSLFLKPVFQWNHDWVMKGGEAALQAEVNRLSRPISPVSDDRRPISTTK